MSSKDTRTAWGQEFDAKRQAWQENDVLKRQILDLQAQVEQLKSLVKVARDSYLEDNADGETDCVTPYDYYLLLNHNDYLAKIREEAGREGFIACLKHVGYTDPDWLHDAEQYVNRLREYNDKN